MSQALAHAIRAQGEHAGLDALMFPAQVIAEASGLIPDYERLCRPAAPGTIRAWLAPLLGCVRFPPSEGDYEIKAAAIAMACSVDVPQAVWTEASQLAAMRAFKVWPSAAEVFDLHQSEAFRLRNRLFLLRQVSKATPIPADAGVVASAPPAPAAGLVGAMAANIAHSFRMPGYPPATQPAAPGRALSVLRRPSAGPKHLSRAELDALAKRGRP